MNTKKVIGAIIFLLGLILLGEFTSVFTDDIKTSILLNLGVLGMIVGNELMNV